MNDLQTLLNLAEEANAHLTGPDQAAWLARLESSYADFVAALEQAEAIPGLRLCVALGRFWWMCGHAVDGQRWLESYLDRPCDDEWLRVQALAAAGGVAYARADYPAARRFLEHAIHLGRVLGQMRDVAGALNQLGMLAREQGRLEEALELHREAEGLYRHLDDEAGMVSCVSNQGVVAFRADRRDEACSYHHEALRRRRKLGDERGIASSLGNLANLARLEGDWDVARRMHEEALEIRRRLGDRWGVAGSLMNLGAVSALAGDGADATAKLAEAEGLFAAVGDALGRCECLDARVVLAARRGECDEARRLHAEAEAARAALGAPLPPVYRAELRRLGVG